MIVSLNSAVNSPSRLVGAPVVVPDADADIAETVTTSVTSKSSMSKDPSVERAASPSSNVWSTSVSSVTVGASLVPVIVTTIFWVTVAGGTLSSEMVTA